MQVKHQTCMLGIGCRYPNGPIKVGQRILLCVRLRFLDPPLDFPNRLQVVINRVAILGTERLLQASDLFAQRIEQASPPLQRRTSFGRRSTFSEDTPDCSLFLRCKISFIIRYSKSIALDVVAQQDSLPLWMPNTKSDIKNTNQNGQQPRPQRDERIINSKFIYGNWAFVGKLC